MITSWYPVIPVLKTTSLTEPRWPRPTAENGAIGQDEMGFNGRSVSHQRCPKRRVVFSLSISIDQSQTQGLEALPGKPAGHRFEGSLHRPSEVHLLAGGPEDEGRVEGHNIRLGATSLSLKHRAEDVLIGGEIAAVKHQEEPRSGPLAPERRFRCDGYSLDHVLLVRSGERGFIKASRSMNNDGSLNAEGLQRT